MNRRRFSYVFVLLAFLASLAVVADTHHKTDVGPSIIAEVFADHMVLQRDQPVNIWGRANSPDMNLFNCYGLPAVPFTASME